jgi:hypothetical protein
VLNLEQSLCHVLMDKALINCILLLDKAAMEKKVKQLKDDQMRFDLTGSSQRDNFFFLLLIIIVIS